MILTAHLTATSANLTLQALEHDGPRLLRSASVPAEQYPRLRPLLRRFAAEELPRLRAAAVAVASCVEDGHCREPLPWDVTAAQIAAALGLPAVDLMDEAVALGEAMLAGEAPESGRQPDAGRELLLWLDGRLGAALLDRGAAAVLPSDAALQPLPAAMEGAATWGQLVRSASAAGGLPRPWVPRFAAFSAGLAVDARAARVLLTGRLATALAAEIRSALGDARTLSHLEAPPLHRGLARRALGGG